MLRLVGLAKTSVTRQHNNVHNTRSVQKDKFLSHEMQLASFCGKAPCGNHSFPFSVVLPSGLPSSMEVGGEGETASNGCHVHAFVRPLAAVYMQCSVIVSIAVHSIV